MKKLVTIILAAVTACIFGVTSFAARNDSVIPNATLNDVLEDYRNALKTGKNYVDLSGYGIVNDSGNKAYESLYMYILRATGDLGSISFGKYSETFAYFDIVKDSSTGVIKGIDIDYSDHYLKEDGSCDIKQVELDRVIVADRFNKAKALARKGMSDAEKALMYYDFVITAVNYPDSEEYNEYGDIVYPDDVYTVTGFLRDGYAVCTAYAKLYALLLNEAGVKAITVESDTILHEWVMVQIDGEWYHCDPTWDDRIFEDDLTALWDVNNDKWDIGASSHRYFLKSDDEIKELFHPDWKISNTVNPDMISKAPASGPSGAFDDKFFSDINETYYCPGAMNYINGNWYFTDLNTSSVVVTAYDGEAELIPMPEGELPKYSFGYKNSLYICTDNSIYRFGTVSNSFEKIMTIPEERIGQDRYTEMRILFDEMTLITGPVVNDTDNITEDLDFDVSVYDMREIEELDALPDTSEKIEAETREDTDTGVIPKLTRPGGSSGKSPANSALESAQTAGKRVSSFIYLGLAVVFLVFGIVAIVLAVKYSKRK